VKVHSEKMVNKSGTGTGWKIGVLVGLLQTLHVVYEFKFSSMPILYQYSVQTLGKTLYLGRR
jgi:hypothetical protein